MLTKAPFRLPDDFLAAFGYRHARRLVALYWEPCGDEACYDDGVSSACGCCDNWLYLDFTRRPQVRDWRDANGLNFGNSDEVALHWWVADTSTGDLYVGSKSEVRSLLLSQRLPDEERNP